LLTEAAEESRGVPMAASWNVGEGRVVAAGFEAASRAVEAMAKVVERKPHDPRFRVSWEAGATVRVTVDAVDDGKFLNDMKGTFELLDDATSGSSHELIPLTQTGPGRYEASVPAPRSPRLARVTVEGHTIEQFALAGRYAPEFDAVGNDHAAMEELARRSGGRVIDPGDNEPVKIDWPAERVPLGSAFGIVGAGLLLTALWWWRRS